MLELELRCCCSPVIRAGFTVGQTSGQSLPVTERHPAAGREGQQFTQVDRCVDIPFVVHPSRLTMTTARTPKSPARFRLPDPPRREPDEMTSYDHLHKPGSAHYLALHFGRPDTTLVEAERWIIAHPDADRSRGRRSDLLIAFDVNPAAYEASNVYIISEQGKPPDFVMEIASETTAETDVGEKRDEYAVPGVVEYWRFDQSGEYHGTRLAGDRLVDGQYVPITIEELPDGNLRGYSAVLNLNLQWNSGMLVWQDPATGRPIVTIEDERQARAEAEAEARAEREGRAQAEAKVRELEQELRRLRDD